MTAYLPCHQTIFLDPGRWNRWKGRWRWNWSSISIIYETLASRKILSVSFSYGCLKLPASLPVSPRAPAPPLLRKRACWARSGMAFEVGFSSRKIPPPLNRRRRQIRRPRSQQQRIFTTTGPLEKRPWRVIICWLSRAFSLLMPFSLPDSLRRPVL